MNFRESGMPAQDYWETLFDVPAILDRFGFGPGTGDVAELGCGYGTFTVPLAQRIAGRVFAIDLDPSMVEATQRRARSAGLRNVGASVRDVLTDGFGAALGSCEAVLLFNILHCEEPVAVLKAAHDVLRPGGLVSVVHWRTDIETPRGPSATIRPVPEQILAWAAAAEGLTASEPPFTLRPWHYGVSLRKATRQQ
jgi:SAM-dependent methyltransferase